MTILFSKPISRYGVIGMTCLGLSVSSVYAQQSQTTSSTTDHTMSHHQQKALPHILILTTGGTIAGQATQQGLGYHAGQTKGEELISSIPALKKEATLTVDAISQIGSQDMSDAVLVKLAHTIEQAEKNQDITGIVITHGTDTMEETAFFLNEVIPHKKPVVLVGAMRPAGYASADGSANLIDAVKVAANPMAQNRPVMIVMNDTILSARFAQKMNTTNLEAFQSPNNGPIGIVNSEHVHFFSITPQYNTSHYTIPKEIPFPRVDIIYSHIQMDGAPIEDAVKRGAKGIILAGVGDGNTSATALNALKKAAEQGIIIVRSSRVGSGFVNRNVEVNDDQNNFVVSEDLNPQKARLLLQILLANKINTPHAIQKSFSKME